MSFIVHSCDISNPVLQFDEFNKWGLRVKQEFYDQYRAEVDYFKLFEGTHGTSDEVG